MSWSAKVLQTLNASKKIKQAAIYDLEGQLLSGSQDFIPLTHKELHTLYRCFPKTSPHPLSSVNIDGKTYRLLQVRTNTLIASHDSDLIVVYLSDHGMILAEGNATDPGSCIHEVLKAWREVELLHGLFLPSWNCHFKDPEFGRKITKFEQQVPLVGKLYPKKVGSCIGRITTQIMQN